MAKRAVSWSERKGLRPSTYAWKGTLLSCERWVIESSNRERACEIEYNGKGCTVDFYKYDPYGCGTILTFSSLGSYELRFRRIYAGEVECCEGDVLAWVNEWRAPVGGVDGGVILSLDEWGNEVAV